MPDTIEFYLNHQSTRFARGQGSRETLIREALNDGPLMCGFTELGQNDDWATAWRVVPGITEDVNGEPRGYQFIGSKAWEPAIAVHPRVQILRSGGEFVHGGKRNPGGYQPRYVVWVQGRIDGNPLLEWFHCVFHSLTKGADPDGSERILMAETVAKLMNEHGRGRVFATASYDLNERDTPENRGIQARVFEREGIVTCWDETGLYPDTFDSRAVSAIDGIARRKGDRRVEFIDADSTDTPESDHHKIRARVRVTIPDPKPVEPEFHDCPLCGVTHQVGVPVVDPT